MKSQYIVQAWESKQYADLFRMALRQASYDEFYAAVAYATWGGVNALDKILREGLDGGWDTVKKQWLVGIDWCRTDPSALIRLAALSNSAARIPNGEFLVSTPGCRAVIPYHPKLFLLRGKETSAIICGSGNLSVCGLTKSCECGSLVWVNHHAEEDADGRSQLIGLLKWFDDTWRNASLFNSSLSALYEKQCKILLKQGRAVPTEDDAIPPDPSQGRGRKAVSEEQIRALRTFDNFWIEAGVLGANLGRGIPGNQLDMVRYTRVFFGIPATDVERNTVIDHIKIVWEGQHYPSQTLKFGNNWMDKLNVPSVGERGSKFYQGKTLLFTRQPDGSYDFVVGGKEQSRIWKRKSRALRLLYAMSGGREWGLF